MTTTRTFLAGLAGLTAVSTLFACSTPGNSASSPADLGPSVTAPAAASAPAVLDSTKLAAALLVANELPAGFSRVSDPSPSAPSGPDIDNPDRSHTDPAECAEVLAPVANQQAGSIAQAVSRFAGPEFSSIDIDAASYPSGAAGAFAQVQRTLGSCVSYTGTDADGITVDYRLGRVEFPSVGDASVAVRATTTSAGLTLTSDVVLAVVGSTLVQISATGQKPIDPSVLTDLTEEQVNKLRGATGT